MRTRNRVVTAISMALFFVLVGSVSATALWQSTASVGAKVRVANLADSCIQPTSMVNASFEEPALPGTLGYVEVGQEPAGFGWRAKNANLQPVRIEVWNGHNGVIADVGTQFVELNADEPGTIYQSLATTPGQTLQWSFLHRGRLGVDTMELFIGAVNAGVSQGSFSDGVSRWVRYSGAYVVPAGQTTTELSFKAVTAAGGPSIGNFLDDVSFGTGPCLKATNTVTNVSLAGTTYRPNDILEFTTVIKNAGSSLSERSVYEGIVPAGLNYVADSITIDGVSKTDAAAGDSANYVAATRAVVARLGSGATDAVGGTIAQGTQTVTVKYRVTVPASAAGSSISFLPKVDYVNGLAPSWGRTAESNTVVVNVAPSADLSTVVTVTPTAISRPSTSSSTVTWTVVVTNNGNSASGPTVTVPITIPSNGATGSRLTGDSAPVVAAGQAATCSLVQCTTPTIAVGETRTFTITRTVPQAAAIGTSYTLLANAYSSVADYNSANDSGSAAATVADTVAPTAAVLSASGTSSTQTTLTWTAATDNVGVTAYNVYRAGVLITTTTALTYTNVGLASSTAYAYTVTAVDAAGNQSGVSNSVTVTTPAPPALPKYQIKTTHLNVDLCLTAAGSSVAENTAVTQSTCSTNTTALTYQRWYASDLGNGYYQIIPQNSGTMAWAIAPGTGLMDDKQKLQLSTYTADASQQWKWMPANGYVGSFVNKKTGKCVDINGQSTVVDEQVQQYTCNGTVAQMFERVPVN